MAGEDNIPPPTSEKSYGVTNIKAFVPLTLDLDELNYDAWRELFETHCMSFGLLGHLDGTTKPKTDDDPDWKKVDSLVKLWIYGTISKSLLQMILKKGVTAHIVWTNLENLFRDNKDARAIQLENDLRNIVLGDLTITDYCHRIKTTADLLANIDAPVSERHLVTFMLNGLPEKFDNIAGIIRHKSPLPTFLQARSMLLMEEQRLSRPRHHQPSHLDTPSSPTILHTDTRVSSTQPPPSNNTGRTAGRNNRQQNYRGRNSGRSNRSGNNPQPGQQPFPTAVPWWAYPPWAFTPRPNSSRSSGYTSAPPSLLGPAPNSGQQPSPQQHALAATTADGPPPPPWSWFPPTNATQATNLHQAFQTLSLQPPSDNGWYMDTDATSHLASDTGYSESPNPPSM